jgi:hypothetical protein
MFAEDTPITLTELAQAMRVSRRTVYRWRKLGYEPEFGRQTTIGHCKRWLREVYAPKWGLSAQALSARH